VCSVCESCCSTAGYLPGDGITVTGKAIAEETWRA